MNEKKSTEQTKEARSLARWRPFGELEAWPRWFAEGPFSNAFLRSWGEQDRAFLPAMDVSEADGHYAITVELPGSRKDDVHVELHEGMLTIRGEKKSEREEKKEQRRYVERSYGSFRRSFRLPSDADAGRLDASFKDGVLTITIPKTEEAKPRTIAVKAAS